MTEAETPVQKSTLREVAALFLKLGLTGFGGPAVHIAMMEEEVVRKRGWMDTAQFPDLVGAANLVPGPNSTELAMHCGQERAGWKGLVVAGCCFIVPAVLITAALAWGYTRYGQLPEVQPFLYGIKPTIIAVVAAVVIRLARKAVKSVALGVLGVAAAIAVLLGGHEILVLFGGGALGMVMQWLSQRTHRLTGIIPAGLLQVLLRDLPRPPSALFLLFLKIGSILYGSGYVLFAFLDAELVTRGWLTKAQLADAIAVGQFTPGPVFSSATFIGWIIGGPSGAAAATAGIFLPSFLFVAFMNPLIPRLRRSPVMSAFLDAVNVVSIAIILSVLVEMGSTSVRDGRTLTILLLSFLVQYRFPKLNTAWVIAGGAIVGWMLWQMKL